MRVRLLVGAALVTVAAWGCGGSSSPASPGPPTGGGGGGGGAITIEILGMGASPSFSPNPAEIAQGAAFVFRNADSEDHRIVAKDGSFDTGVLEPGETSQPIVLTTDGARYYCALHPSMVGSINASNGVPPPCSGLYC